jgi:hypothetical protein
MAYSQQGLALDFVMPSNLNLKKGKTLLHNPLPRSKHSVIDHMARLFGLASLDNTSCSADKQILDLR